MSRIFNIAQRAVSPYNSSLDMVVRAVLQVTHLQDDEVVLIVAKDHPLAAAEQISKQQLSSLKFVALHRSSTVQAIHETLEKHGVNWRGLPVVMVSATVSPLTANH